MPMELGLFLHGFVVKVTEMTKVSHENTDSKSGKKRIATRRKGKGKRKEFYQIFVKSIYEIKSCLAKLSQESTKFNDSVYNKVKYQSITVFYCSQQTME